MNPHCLKVGWDVEEMRPYRPSCCGVGYFETIQIQGVLLAAGAHHERDGVSGKLAGYANFTRNHMIESASWPHVAMPGHPSPV
jgi:hypothetical protein